MTRPPIDYPRLEQRALLHVVRWALEQAAGPEGPPGEHHFFISFLTGAPGVEVPSFLREKHPHDMTIVLKSRFRDLEVDPEGFSVTLWFEGREAELQVPFGAVTQFLDPAASFVLRFDPQTGAADGELTADPSVRLQLTSPSAEERPDAEVVSLDAFRRRNEDEEPR